MKRARPRRRAAGLLDLPAECMDIILSFLGTLSLAAVCLACRALRDAAIRSRKGLVVIKSKDYSVEGHTFTARARALPRVLQLMHKFQTVLDRVITRAEKAEAIARAVNRAGEFLPEQSAYYSFWRLQASTQLLTSIAEEVVFLKIRAPWLAFCKNEGELLLKSNISLPQMRQLESLHVDGPLSEATLRELPSLRHLTCLKLAQHCSKADMQELCNKLILSRLDLGRISWDCAPALEEAVAILASGATSGLQELVLPVRAVAETPHLRGLSALTALTALSLHTQRGFADLGGLQSVTGLKRLLVDSFDTSLTPTAEKLSPLTALSGLTLLDLGTLNFRNPPSDVSVLSTLTALQVLRCSFFLEAEVADGDPLPVQLRFLHSAPALKVLDLGFFASFWDLPDASICAVREAIRGLLCLKHVVLRFAYQLKQYYPPLSAFAAASSIETLCFSADGPRSDCLIHTPAQARGCFKALTKLRGLSVVQTSPYGCVPHCAALLAGLPSDHLVCMSLSIGNAEMPSVQEIARFPDLQSLTLVLNSAQLQVLPQLSVLKCLTELVVMAPLGVCEDRSRSMLRGRIPSEVETAIREYGRVVGVPVRATVWGT